jgi:hypothetical protein
MAASSGIMMAGASISGAISQAEAQRAQGDYQKKQGEINAMLAENRADEALDRGRGEANTARRKGNAMAASQKVAMAAQGLDVGAGSGADEVLQSTQDLSAVEQMNIKTNAWREAWGFRVDAINSRAEGNMANNAGKSAAKQTLIAGGMQAASYGMSGFKGQDKKKPTTRTGTP